MHVIDGVDCLDLNFHGEAGVIASYLIRDRDDVALIEVGPGSTLPALLERLREAGVDPAQVGKVMVTHIHLDHAGAAGALLQHCPNARLYVHEHGVRHLVDPSKLLASAARIWGDQMGPLWGEFLPVPEERINVINDGDIIPVGSRQLRILYTPGHASHHVSFYDGAHDAVFTGDVAGVRLDESPYVRPPTPPPDLDLELWSRSLDCLRDLKVKSLVLTHFGRFSNVDEHLSQIEKRLYEWNDLLLSREEANQDREVLIRELTEHGDREMGGVGASRKTMDRYELATPYFMSVDGYLRHFRKRPAPKAPEDGSSLGGGAGQR